MIDLFNSESPALHTNGIYTGIRQRMTGSFDIRRHIFSNQGASTEHGMLANVDKLMDRTHSAEDSPITNSNMTGDLCVIAHDAVITYNAIMRQVAVSHEQAIFSN